MADGLIGNVQINPMNFPRAFLDYCYYIVLLLGPISFLSPIHLWGKIKSRTYVITIIIGILFSIITIRYGYNTVGSAEMNFGVLDFLLNGKMVIVIKAVCSSIFVFLVLDIFIEQKKGVDHFLRFLIIISITYLFVCSMGRPVQRYLIFCLPFMYYFLVFYRLNYRRLVHVIILVVTLITFSVTNITFVLYQVSQGSAAENMVKWLSDANLLRHIDPSEIFVHSGHNFIPFLTANQRIPHKYLSASQRYVQYDYLAAIQSIPHRYYVSTSKRDDQIVLHEESVNLFGCRIRTYYCIKY